MTSLKITLRSVLREGDNFIVIDALDECPNQEGKRSHLYALLQEISSWGLPNLHILTTSRREPDIEQALTRISNISSLAIQNSRVDTDIRQYVEAQLGGNTNLTKWSDELKEEIKKSLVEDAHGM